MNEKRVFSNDEVLNRLKDLNVEMVIVDNTSNEERINKDVARADRAQLPVNLIYPPNYPDEPAVLLEALISPASVLKVLDRMEEIVKLDDSPSPQRTASR